MSSEGKESSPSPPSVSPLPPPGMTPEQQQKVDELERELHKMKAIVLKHEVRIRDLEKTLVTHGISLATDQNEAHSKDVKNNGDTTTH